MARCLGAVLTSTMVAAAVVVVAPTHAAVPRTPHRYTAKIENLAGYSPQQKCSAWAKPGTTAFANMLLRTYRDSRSLGIVRSCNIGGSSEHKEGRAFDWGVSAYNARDRRSVNALMTWLLQTDRFGNRFAMARRLGIQYMIWNRRIWGSYAASSGWRPYTGASPHTDHVHFSLSWKGARKLTSFWRPRRFGKPAPRPPKPPAPKPRPHPNPKPTPKPTPKQNPPAARAIPEPRAPKTLARGPRLVDETVVLSARRRAGVTTKGALRKGRRYLIEASGSFRYTADPRSRADAECSTAYGSDWWRERSVREDQPDADHLDLYIDGSDLLADSDSGASCDPGTSTYRWMYEPERSGRAPLRIWDPTRHSDNQGRLRVRVVDLAEQDTMEWKLPANAAAGATSPGSLRAGVAYDLTVRGTWKDGADATVDAECTSLASDRRWRRDRPDDPSVLLDRSGVRLEPTVSTGGGCNARNHTYTYTFTPGTTRPVNLRVDDAGGFGDNRGALAVSVEPHVVPAAEPQPAPQPEPAPQPKPQPEPAPQPTPLTTEQLTVDSRQAEPVLTSQVYPRNTRLRVTVSGWYMLRDYRTHADWIGADAECTIAHDDRRWIVNRFSGQFNGRRRPLGDLAVNGNIDTWRPTAGSGSCNEVNHTYTYDMTTSRDAPLSLVIADDTYDDNWGSLDVTVEVR